MAAPSSENNAGASLSCTDSAVEAFVADATDIRDLLYKYRADAELLRHELSSFVHREIDEQAQFSHLRASVNQTELASLHDPRFIEYLARREAEEKRVAPSAFSAGDATISDQTDGVGATNASADFQWWAQRMKEEGSPWLRCWTPDAALPLAAFRRLSDVWKGWKHTSAAYDTEFDRMLEEVYASTPPSSCSADMRYCCFGNGAICILPIKDDVAIMDGLEKRVSLMAGASSEPFSRSPSSLSTDNAGYAVASVLDSYFAELTSAVAMTRDELHEKVSTLMQKKKLANADSHATVADSFRLTGDAWDTLSFAHPDRLKHAVMVRGFFFKGRLSLVEQLGAEVDVVPLFFAHEKGSSMLEERGQRVQRLFAQTLSTLYRELERACNGATMLGETALPPNAALTVAVKVPSSERDVVKGVLLDVHPVSPQLPFDGHVTWMDVCAVGRQRACAPPGTQGPLGAAAVSRGSSDEECSVLFRLTRLPVASLQPYDAVSRRVFPLLNRQLTADQRRKHERTDEDVEVPTGGVASVSYSVPSMTVPICVGAVACVAAALSVACWVRRS
ncbi:conserved hypothetical protein [Leishmania infantum JPCM5]|uniref:Uncharacterized protein n=2 Tax=Leishmania infantum TaxID=5671 RepID=A4HXG6_LEIIN|nr:conserved hypothetical protein [Leishmania infantum JPCM5]CAC9478350.1 hypothetical_protein_-_conserved [Leishmania infantum]CAM59785.1 conserved hypothetical protein [Leishmania infantum JPCM5]SUZ40861.1 hypothetical_protein_-_conserved [Leishmania infantum]|eukprot:XP_001464757.1 conserved hypothetical protein [Leishmania infantum JPCM5]